ncbi:hypothetical protein, partial [Corynebacterium glyciniphilum]|uniref:hypothetical protein n=1 Tax=Corynebacterium glyciniphilum TaxID=1404244 RepID=UPI001C92ECA9
LVLSGVVGEHGLMGVEEVEEGVGGDEVKVREGREMKVGGEGGGGGLGGGGVVVDEGGEVVVEGGVWSGVCRRRWRGKGVGEDGGWRRLGRGLVVERLVWVRWRRW